MTLPLGLQVFIRGHRREAGIATAGVVMASLAGGILALRETTENWPAATARTGAFIETIVEAGTISAQHLMLYSSAIQGAPAKLVEIRGGRAGRPGRRTAGAL